MAAPRKNPRVSTEDRLCKLPDELLRLILDRLTLLDFVRFAAVCTSWRSLLTEGRYRPACQLPWRMRLSARIDDGKWRFYCQPEGKALNVRLPTGYRRLRCGGSSKGWLVMVSRHSAKIALVDPISCNLIRLPVPPIKPWHIRKAVLSSPPTSGQCVVAAVMERKLISCSLGDEAWTVLRENTYYADIVFFQGSLYALKKSINMLKICSFDPQHIYSSVSFPMPLVYDVRLLEFRGGLFITETCGTRYKLFRIDIESCNLVEEDQESLEPLALFIDISGVSEALLVQWPSGWGLTTDRGAEAVRLYEKNSRWFMPCTTIRWKSELQCFAD